MDVWFGEQGCANVYFLIFFLLLKKRVFPSCGMIEYITFHMFKGIVF